MPNMRLYTNLAGNKNPYMQYRQLGVYISQNICWVSISNGLPPKSSFSTCLFG